MGSGKTPQENLKDQLYGMSPEEFKANPNEYIRRRETAWANRDDASGRQERLLLAQKNQKALEEAQKKNADELSMALKFQKQFAAKAQGKNGTLLTNPGASGAAPVPAPGQKTLIGQ